MPLEKQFVCPLPNGIHARPASTLEEAVRGFRSEVTLLNKRTRRSANSKSILAVVGTDVRLNDPCVFRVSGPDEQQAMAELTVFLRDIFPHCDPPPKTEPGVNRAGASRLPPCLSRAGAVTHRGTVVVPGIAQGRGVFAIRDWNPAALPLNGAVNPAKEWGLLETALEKLAAECDLGMPASGGKIGTDLLKVHRSIARDTEFRERLRREISQGGRTVAGALAATEKHFADMLAGTGNELLRERAFDIQDVCARLARHVYGEAVGGPRLVLSDDSIVFAETLTPGQFLALDRKFLKGLVLSQASPTSHTAILANSFNIPMLSGIAGLARANAGSRDVIVDANAGVLVTDLNDATRRYYEIEQRKIAARRARLRAAAARPAATRDGRRVEAAANIATAGEAAAAFENGAESIGLFRTEMLFMDRQEPPGEAEQFEVYRAVLAAAGPRPVAIRTLDAGGDKHLAYLNLPHEENPFLGSRAVRIYPRFEALFRGQIRALVRASAHGNLRVMIPMIATVGEARWVRRVIADEQKKCAAEKIPFDASMRVGAMIEVPSAAFSMDALARELDFFSIGSNDLLQYFMAADRMNTRLGALHDPLQPAFLRLLAHIADAAREAQREIGLCGEIGAQVKILPLLAGLGLDKISVSAPMISTLKTELAALDYGECRDLVAQASRCASADEVSALLERHGSGHAPPLLDLELVITDSDAATKEEAIKQAADLMYVLGRTDDSHAVEEAIWLRESKYTTGFGHGFAMPHCKTNAVRADSLVLAKLRAPVEWGSLDGQPVRVMLMLAIRESHGANAHMKVLAQLARKVMDDEFRAAIERENDPARLHTLLRQTLSP